jgi:hypothetical protein
MESFGYTHNLLDAQHCQYILYNRATEVILYSRKEVDGGGHSAGKPTTLTITHPTSPAKLSVEPHTIAPTSLDISRYRTIS